MQLLEVFCLYCSWRGEAKDIYDEHGHIKTHGYAYFSALSFVEGIFMQLVSVESTLDKPDAGVLGGVICQQRRRVVYCHVSKHEGGL